MTKLFSQHDMLCTKSELSRDTKGVSINSSTSLPVVLAQMVVAQRYKWEGRGFDFLCCHWNFFLTQSFRPLYGPGVDSVFNRNDY